MKPAIKIIGFTIIGAVVGALLGLLYGYLFSTDPTRILFDCSMPGIITGALVFLEISSINELTRTKSKLVRCLSIVFAIILAFIIVIVLVPFLSTYFNMLRYNLFVKPKLSELRLRSLG